MKLLFMDEAASEPLKAGGRVVVITSVVVPLQSYAAIRSRYYSEFRKTETVGKRTINLRPLELHGRKLLPDASDEDKLAALSKVVDIVLSFDLGVYRLGYLADQTFTSFFKSAEAPYGLAWADMVDALRSELKDGPLIPIADAGNPKVAEHLSRFVTNLDHLREAGLGPDLSVQHTENIIGEVFFGDSKYSIFVQIADIVSYLRLQIDMNRAGWVPTAFKSQVLEIAKRLEPALRVERVREAKMVGSAMHMTDLGS